MATSQGHHCEFIDAVPEDFYCKKCTLVSRRLSISSCCGESFCKACLASTCKQGKPCPACGEKGYNIIERPKNQRRINCLRVYCSMKERGCDWLVTLEQLDTHLGPDQDNCQYVDTKCPLNCHMTIPKNKVEQHVAQHCTKRPYVCQYCNFKATYKEVVDKHLPECKYVPLQCPNLCGVTFERDFMEDHMKMCRLEEVGCEFSGVGCDGRFIREDQEEHTRQNSRKHLTLTASLAVETKEQLQLKLLEQDKKHKEEEKKLRQKINEQEKKIENLEKKLLNQNKDQKELEKALKEEQKQKLKEQKEFLEHQVDLKLHGLEQKLLDLTDQNKANVSKLSSMIVLNRRFEMKNYSTEKAKDKTNDWFGPAMYTHLYGYKFCIGVDANGDLSGRGKSIHVAMVAIAGEFDDELKWPVKVKFTIELFNQQGGKNASYSRTWSWGKPIATRSYVGSFYRIAGGFFEHSKLNNFLNNDILYFYVSEVQLS